MHYKVAIEFRSKLGFNQYDVTLTKEQSVLKSVMENRRRYARRKYTNSIQCLGVQK